jgi:hypothetical protein
VKFFILRLVCQYIVDIKNNNSFPYLEQTEPAPRMLEETRLHCQKNSHMSARVHSSQIFFENYHQEVLGWYLYLTELVVDKGQLK